MNGKVVIIGTGRCGTKFASGLFSRMGVDVPHERLGANGISCWDLASGSTLLSDVKDVESLFYDATVIHLVRNPVDCINSITTIRRDTWQWITANSPASMDDSTLLRSIKHWLYWNKICEAVADVRIRLEDLSCDHVRVIFPESTPCSLSGISRNGRKHGQESLESMYKCSPELIYRIRRLTKDYGYIL